MVSESSGRNDRERNVTSKWRNSMGPRLYALGEGSMSRRTLTEAADHSGRATATARGQGRVKQLEKPVSPIVKTVEPGGCITDINREIGGRRAGVGWANSSDEAK